MLSEIKDISDFKKLDKNMVYEMDKVLTHDIPMLLKKATTSRTMDSYPIVEEQQQQQQQYYQQGRPNLNQRQPYPQYPQYPSYPNTHTSHQGGNSNQQQQQQQQQQSNYPNYYPQHYQPPPDQNNDSLDSYGQYRGNQ